MKTPTILSLGEVLWDLFPEGPRLGGAPANFACHAALLQARVAMVSAVGADERGTEAKRILNAYGVDISLVQDHSDANTGTVGVVVHGDGKPSYAIHEDAAWDGIVWTSALGERVVAADAVYYGTLGQRGAVSRATIRQALDVAAAADVRRVLDVNLRKPFYSEDMIRESVARASVLKISDEELDEVTEACGLANTGTVEARLHSLRRKYRLELVAMTRGSAGALLVTERETVDQPGIPTKVVDTVGAGDSFTAAMTVGLLRDDALTSVARTACEIAAAVCAQAGAVPPLS